MKQRFEKFLSDWVDTTKRDTKELAELFLIATGKSLECKKATCISHAVTEVRKYYGLNLEKEEEPKKRHRLYHLKPGNHFLHTGAKPINNDNTSDADIEFLIEHYPHVKELLIHE